MKLHTIAWILLVVGGLNWLCFGIFGWDIVGKIFGGMESTISQIVYILVGLAAVYEIVTHKKNCNCCSVAKTSGSSTGM